MKQFKLLLDLLPFSGEKTKLFGWLTAVVASLQAAGIDPQVVIAAIIQNPTKSVLIALVVSLLHKVLKQRFPDLD